MLFIVDGLVGLLCSVIEVVFKVWLLICIISMSFDVYLVG